MTGVDTNVLLRYLVQDDEEQSPLADAVFAGFTPTLPGYVSGVTLCEMVWVLRTVYRYPLADVTATLRLVVNTPSLVIEHEPLVLRAVEGAASGGAGFADRLISELHALAGVTLTLTFDKAASKLDGWRRLG